MSFVSVLCKLIVRCRAIFFVASIPRRLNKYLFSPVFVSRQYMFRFARDKTILHALLFTLLLNIHGVFVTLAVLYVTKRADYRFNLCWLEQLYRVSLICRLHTIEYSRNCRIVIELDSEQKYKHARSLCITRSCYVDLRDVCINLN